MPGLRKHQVLLAISAMLVLFLLGACSGLPAPDQPATLTPVVLATSTPLPPTATITIMPSATSTVAATDTVIEPTEEPRVLEYISQEEGESPFSNDCAAADVLMVARYYDVAGEETVGDIQYDMIGCNCVVTFDVLRDYLRSTYGLDVEVVVTLEPIIPKLEEAGFDVSGITVVEDIPHDVPVIWMYNANAHWVIRYQGWNYDPIFGKYLFTETKNLHRPDLGIGLIVTKPEE
ncbi:MAG: hypothetical protein DRI46_01460 [Chloroflexi bacterium]|nr:MAG: hypothetical protein DRI46_01460 [Chloroflexota bacterium]